MPSAAHQRPVEAFVPYGPDPAFGEGVRPGSADRRSDHLNAFGAEHLIERARVLCVAVAEEEADSCRPVLEGEGEVACLLADPGRVGIGRDAGHMDTPGVKLDEEEDVEPLQPDGLHSQEVRGDDALCLCPQELRPRRAMTPGSRTQPMGPEQPADRGGADADADLAKLTLNPHVTPARVLPGESQDGLTKLRVD